LVDVVYPVDVLLTNDGAEYAPTPAELWALEYSVPHATQLLAAVALVVWPVGHNTHLLLLAYAPLAHVPRPI